MVNLSREMDRACHVVWCKGLGLVNMKRPVEGPPSNYLLFVGLVEDC